MNSLHFLFHMTIHFSFNSCSELKKAHMIGLGLGLLMWCSEKVRHVLD